MSDKDKKEGMEAVPSPFPADLGSIKAELPGPDAARRGKALMGSIPRRYMLLGAAGAALAVAANPAKALADWGSPGNLWTYIEFSGWDSTSSHDFGSNGTINNDYFTANYNAQGNTYTPWYEWKMWSVNWLGAAMNLDLKVDYINELFTHITYRPTVAALSQVSNRSQGWQISPEDDCRYELLYSLNKGASPKTAISATFDMDTTSDWVKAYGYSARVYTDWNNFSAPVYYTNFEQWGKSWEITWRRGYDVREVWSKMTGAWWYFWTPEYGQDGARTYGATRWITYDVTKAEATRNSNGDRPTRGVEWAGRIVTISPAFNQKMGVYCGNGVDAAAQGASIGIWDDVNALNRAWYCYLNTTGTEDAAAWAVTNPWKGTISFKNLFQAVAGSGSRWLDQKDVWVGKNSGSAAQIWSGSSTRAGQCFWISTKGGKQYIISDGTGCMLNRCSGGTANGTNLQFYTGGTGNDYASDHNAWVIKDLWYRLRDGKSLTISNPRGAGKPAMIGDTLTCSNAKDATIPYGIPSGKSLGYVYHWMLLEPGDDGKWINDQVCVMGQANLSCYGDLPLEQPVLNHLGAMRQGQNLGAFKLYLKGSSLDGGIQYRVRNGSKNWEGWAQNGSWAGKKGSNNRITGLQVKLTGAIAAKYRVAYRVGSTSGGWGSWVDDGNTAVSKDHGIEALAVRLIPRSVSDGQSLKVTTGMIGKRIACITRAYLDGDAYFLGYAGTATAISVASHIRVYYHADGELMFTQTNVNPLTAFSVSADGVAACKRDGCDGITAFYTDPNYKNAWVNGTKTSSQDMHLYCRNKVSVTVDLVDESRDYFREHQPYEESVLAETFDLGFFPHKAATRTQLYYKDAFVTATAEAELPSRVWVEAMGPKEVPRIEGLYGSKSAKHTDPAKKTFTLTGSLKLYTAFKTPWYDGFAAS